MDPTIETGEPQQIGGSLRFIKINRGREEKNAMNLR